jgi:L-fucose mutarotase
MIQGKLIHPQILGALARAGHGSKVLISDGNYPHWTARGPNAEVVYLILAPGMLGVCEVLRVVMTAVPIEHAMVMSTGKNGSDAVEKAPEIWGEFRELLQTTGCRGELAQVERFAFYKAAGGADVCLTIATGEERIFANLLLTIGVVG